MAGCAVSVAPVNAELSVLGHSGHAGGLAPSAGLAEMGLHRVGRPDVLPPQQRSRSWAFGWHPRIRPADTGACQVDWSGSVTALRRPSCGRFCMTQTSIPRLAGRVQPGDGSSPPKQGCRGPGLPARRHGLLRRIYALIAVKHGSRRAHLMGVSASNRGVDHPSRS